MLDKETVKIEGIEEISNERLKSLLFLYEELIDIRAIHLYQCLIYLNHGTLYSVSQLLDILHIKEETLREMMHELERLQLIKTYKKGDEYLIDVLAPLNCNEFFASEIFDRYLATKTKDRYRSLRALLIRESSDKTDYVDISAKADLSSWSSIDEKDYRDIKALTDSSIFPLKKFLKVSKNLFPESLRTYDNLDYIKKLGEAYGIGLDEMRRYVNESIVRVKDPFIDKSALLKKCQNARKHTVYTDEGYLMATNDFLMQLLNVDKLNFNDRKIINRLISKEFFDLDHAVVNVLLEYVYKKKDRLDQNLIYAIASDWVNKKIDTVDKAKDRIRQINNQDKQSVKADFDPVYNTKDNPSISDEEVLEYLKTMKGGTDG